MNYEVVDLIHYLRSLIMNTGGSEKEINRRLTIAKNAIYLRIKENMERLLGLSGSTGRCYVAHRQNTEPTHPLSESYITTRLPVKIDLDILVTELDGKKVWKHLL